MASVDRVVAVAALGELVARHLGGVRRHAGAAAAAGPTGNVWVVTRIDTPLTATYLWQMLQDPHTFSP